MPSGLNQQMPIVPVGPVGTVQSYTASGGFQVGTIVIDNPSGMWLNVRPSYTLVPPNTLARRIVVEPKASTIYIDYVDAPTGGVPSAVTGGPISVHLYEEQSVDDVGADYTLYPAVIDLTAAIAALQASIDNLKAGWGTTPVLTAEGQISDADGFVAFIAGVANQRIVVVSASVTFSSTSLWPRGYFRCGLQFATGTTRLITLSAENPYQSFNIPPGGFIGAVAEDLDAFVNEINDDPNFELWFTVDYYLLQP